MFDENVGKEPGIQIWRIEDFEAVPYDESKYGQFYTGDSYIVLKTSERSSRLRNDIFFWLGSETSQDESGTAAIKSVELDEQLSGAAIQHREMQGHESAVFESCFKKGIRYLPGGIKSGFSHVDPEDVVKRLFQIKGKRNVRVAEIALDPDLVNQSDCYVLDLGKGHDILVYRPPGAKRVEKFKSSLVANEIRDEDHAGDANVVLLDESDDNSRFFEELGVGSANDLVGDDGDDNVDDRDKNVVLYKVSDDSGECNVTEVAQWPLTQDMLNKDDCFLLNTGKFAGIFLWIGKEASKKERLFVLKAGEDFLAKQNLPKWTKIERVVDGGETSLFKQFFKFWTESEDSPATGLGRKYPPSNIAEWDVASLHAENRRRLSRSRGTAIGFMPDNGNGTKKIWKIEDFTMVPLEDEKYGMFFGGDSYIIQYEYNGNRGTGYIVYFWLGNESSQDERASAAINAIKLDDDLNGKAVQVRVVQGQEPQHFFKIFQGKMIVFSGGKASGFKNVHDHDTYDIDGTRLFRVRATSPDTTRAVQMPEKAESLNSDDVFILETPKNTWIWHGKGSSDEEKELAGQIVSLVSPDSKVETINEGGESDDFWSGLGGKMDYPKGVEMDKPILCPRLFHCFFSQSGKFRASEIFDFKKDDLVSDDVMILDSGDEIYVWNGSDADKSEKEKGYDLAMEYLKNDPTHRNETNTLLMTVKEGDEPKSFLCVFS
uniref:Gelsolin-like domain-containing protein n=1 Tax=Lepeophtheirus salmonis TaxID=72036 RepID=A0A0K2UCV6_LEPSM